MGEKPGFFPNGPTPQLQEKAGLPSSNHFFVLYTEIVYVRTNFMKGKNEMRKIAFQGKMNAFFKAGLTALLLLCLAGSALGEEIKAIHIVTPSWEDETNKDGTGLFFGMVRKIYEPVGIKMEYKIVPWKRAERMLASNQADAMLYAALQNVILAPKNPLTLDYLSVVFKKDRVKEWKGPETLNGKRV